MAKKAMAGTAAAVEMMGRKLAVVTGASSGIGLELAKVFARNGFDLIVAGNER